MKLQTVEDLFLRGLQYSYDAEKQLTVALPKMADASSAPELKQAFQKHFSETKEHVTRAEEIFKLLGKQPEAKPNSIVQQMQREAEQMIAETDQSPIRDAALIVAGNQVEHFEMAVYGSLRNYAQLLGRSDILPILEKTLQEEKQADAQLTEVGEQRVNIQAIHASAAAAEAR
jgi:ferritin-like metal-binding protein YciE